MVRLARLVVYIYVGLLLAGCGLLTPASDEYVWRLIPNEEANVNWRLEIRNPTGSLKHYRYANPSSSQSLATITSIDWMEVSPNGDCREAQITGLARGLGLAARDIVTIQFDTGGGWRDLWTGYVARLPNAESRDVERVRLLGLRQQFKERIMRKPITPGGDLATMVQNGSTEYPLGVIVPASIPLVNMQLGDRRHNYETAYEYIEALANLGGVTAAGPIVWGVGASRNLFFRRAGSSEITLNEATQNLRVSWEPIDSDQVTSAVSVIVANEIQASGIEIISVSPPDYQPWHIAHRYEDAAWTASYRNDVAIPAPSGTPLFRSLTSPEISTANIAGVGFGTSFGALIDDNAATGISNTGNSVPDTIDDYAELTLDVPVGTALTYGARVLFNATGASLADIDIEYSGSGAFASVKGRLSTSASGQQEVRVIFPLDVSESFRFWPGDPANTMTIRLSFTGVSAAGAVVVNAIEPLALDEGLLDAVAASKIRLPAIRPAEVTRYGTIYIPRPFANMTLNNATGGVYAVAAYRFFIDPVRGYGTTVKIEQDRSADDQAYLRLIDRRQVDTEREVIRWDGGR